MLLRIDVYYIQRVGVRAMPGQGHWPICSHEGKA